MVIFLGNFCGNVVINFFFRSGRKKIIKFFERFLRIKKEMFESVNSFFVKYGIFVVLVVRIIGVLCIFVIFLVGISKMNFYEYVIFLFIGNIIWVMFYVYFYWYGFSFFKFFYKKDIYFFWFVILGLVCIVIIVWIIFLKLWRRRR